MTTIDQFLNIDQDIIDSNSAAISFSTSAELAISIIAIIIAAAGLVSQSVVIYVISRDPPANLSRKLLLSYCIANATSSVIFIVFNSFNIGANGWVWGSNGCIVNFSLSYYFNIIGVLSLIFKAIDSHVRIVKRKTLEKDTFKILTSVWITGLGFVAFPFYTFSWRHSIALQPGKLWCSATYWDSSPIIVCFNAFGLFIAAYGLHVLVSLYGEIFRTYRTSQKDVFQLKQAEQAKLDLEDSSREIQLAFIVAQESTSPSNSTSRSNVFTPFLQFPAAERYGSLNVCSGTPPQSAFALGDLLASKMSSKSSSRTQRSLGIGQNFALSMPLHPRSPLVEYSVEEKKLITKFTAICMGYFICWMPLFIKILFEMSYQRPISPIADGIVSLVLCSNSLLAAIILIVNDNRVNGPVIDMTIELRNRVSIPRTRLSQHANNQNSPIPQARERKKVMDPIIGSISEIHHAAPPPSVAAISRANSQLKQDHDANSMEVVPQPPAEEGRRKSFHDILIINLNGSPIRVFEKMPVVTVPSSPIHDAEHPDYPK